MRQAARVAILAALLSACATNVEPIPDDQRCARFGGMWQAGTCLPLDGGGWP